MCACRCGIKVYLQDGSIRYIEGNRNHPVNRGVLCAKGSAGIMHVNSPARLRNPLKRVGPRGSGEFKEIDWDEALDIATGWLARARATNPRRLAFFNRVLHGDDLRLPDHHPRLVQGLDDRLLYDFIADDRGPGDQRPGSRNTPSIS